MAEITQTISTVTSLPTPPNPNVPSTFDALAYPYTVAQNAFGLDVNDMAAAYRDYFRGEISMVCVCCSMVCVCCSA